MSGFSYMCGAPRHSGKEFHPVVALQQERSTNASIHSFRQHDSAVLVADSYYGSACGKCQNMSMYEMTSLSQVEEIPTLPSPDHHEHDGHECLMSSRA